MAEMSDKQRVLAVHPDAECRLYCDGEYIVIRRAGGYDELGGGDSDDAAWADAASKLPALPVGAETRPEGWNKMVNKPGEEVGSCYVKPFPDQGQAGEQGVRMPPRPEAKPIQCFSLRSRVMDSEKANAHMDAQDALIASLRAQLAVKK